MPNSERNDKRLFKKEHIKKESLCQWISLLLSLCMLVSLFSGMVSFTALALEVEQTEPKEETREEIKARLLQQIKVEGWDPYSADMSTDEFYALMELFQEGTLPMEEEGSELEGSFTDLYIPSTMFLFSGLNTENLPESHSETGKAGTARTRLHSPADLDSYHYDYTRPPEEWHGVEINDNMQVRVIVPGSNKEDHTISGDVDQKLFPQYDGYYVRRVTAQNSDVNILGVIRLRSRIAMFITTPTTKNRARMSALPSCPRGRSSSPSTMSGSTASSFR